MSPRRYTTYFRWRVLVQRPYVREEWCVKAIESSIHREIQSDGRIRHWVFIEELGRYLRVITLADGETIHNAFPDRGFKLPDR